MDKTGSLAEYVPDAHQIVIEGQHRARITGVVDVETFHEEEAAILTEAGMPIEGVDVQPCKEIMEKGDVGGTGQKSGQVEQHGQQVQDEIARKISASREAGYLELK